VDAGYCVVCLVSCVLWPVSCILCPMKLYAGRIGGRWWDGGMAVRVNQPRQKFTQYSVVLCALGYRILLPEAPLRFPRLRVQGRSSSWSTSHPNQQRTAAALALALRCRSCCRSCSCFSSTHDATAHSLERFTTIRTTTETRT
jgi:hypothetical protein